MAHELRRLGSAATPDDAARERMRRKLLRSMPAQPTPLPTQPTPLLERTRRSAMSARLLVATAAAACVLFALTGLSLLLARDALPGDSLYEVKQLGERASLGLTFDEQGRARKHLDIAATRVGELQSMSDSGVTDAAYYSQTFAGLDSNAATGARQFIALGAGKDLATGKNPGTGKDDTPLAELRRWLDTETAQLRALRLPDEVRERAEVTAQLLDRITERTAELRDRLGCTRITSGLVDKIGLLPATGKCAPATQRPGDGPPAADRASRPSGDAGKDRSRPARPPNAAADGVSPGPRSPAPSGPGGSSSVSPPADRGPGQPPRKPKPPRRDRPPANKPRPPLDLPPLDLPPLLPELPKQLPGLLPR